MKVAIFDYDGTIVYSEHLWRKTYDTFDKEFNLPIICDEERKRQLSGTVKRLASEYLENNSILYEHFNEETLTNYFNQKTEEQVIKTEPIDGIVNYFNKLNTTNIPIIIASSGRKGLINNYLNQWNLQVNDIVTTEDVIHGKPEIDVYVEAMKRGEKILKTRIKPEECIIFEDNPLPARNASNYGFQICMIQSHKDSIFGNDFDFANYIINSFNNINFI